MIYAVFEVLIRDSIRFYEAPQIKGYVEAEERNAGANKLGLKYWIPGPEWKSWGFICWPESAYDEIITRIRECKLHENEIISGYFLIEVDEIIEKIK